MAHTREMTDTKEDRQQQKRNKYDNAQWPSKSYSHLHVGEGWKQTDTSFPIVLHTYI